MSSTISLPSDAATAPRVWWREPYLWLVIVGPLVVVVAALVTAAIAVKNQDPVLNARNTGQAAMVGRNHAASPPSPAAGK